MHFRFIAVTLVLPLSACDTFYHANYVTAISELPEENCVANALARVSGVSDVKLHSRSSKNMTQVLPRYKKIKYHLEVVTFSYETQTFSVQSSKNEGEMGQVTLDAGLLGSCPSPEYMESLFKMKEVVAPALSNTCFDQSKFDLTTLYPKECPDE